MQAHVTPSSMMLFWRRHMACRSCMYISACDQISHPLHRWMVAAERRRSSVRLMQSTMSKCSGVLARMTIKLCLHSSSLWGLSSKLCSGDAIMTITCLNLVVILQMLLDSSQMHCLMLMHGADQDHLWHLRPES